MPVVEAQNLIQNLNGVCPSTMGDAYIVNTILHNIHIRGMK